ncbi:MAG: hypothetical protein J6B51_07515 [Clostridia bacterium]|nr:hypothetical protein [Clostridia bacterium]MBO5299906.1 hypothetical protein [Clostridia bacterium]
MENNKDTFNYTYSAKQQDEIKAIRKKYAVSDPEDKMERLRKLDGSVVQKATTAALILGIIGALIMGSGMSLVMTDIGSALGIENPLFIGIPVGIVGLILVSFAYPVYNHIVKKEREKIAPEIIRLTDELMK